MTRKRIAIGAALFLGACLHAVGGTDDAGTTTDASVLQDATGSVGRDASSDASSDAASSDASAGPDVFVPQWCALGGEVDVGVYPYVPCPSLVPEHDAIESTQILLTGVRQNPADGGAVIRFYDDPSLYPCCDIE